MLEFYSEIFLLNKAYGKAKLQSSFYPYTILQLNFSRYDLVDNIFNQISVYQYIILHLIVVDSI